MKLGAEDLPLSQYRYVIDLGATLMQRRHKATTDVLDYKIDLMDQLGDGEDVIACRAWADAGPLAPTRLLFNDYVLVLWIAGGAGGAARAAVSVEATTSKGRVLQLHFAVVTDGVTVWVARMTIDAPERAVVSVRSLGDAPQEDDDPEITVTPAALTFPGFYYGGVSDPQLVTVKNTGKVPARFTSINVSGRYRQTNTSEMRLEPGQSFQISVTFAPLLGAPMNGQLEIDIGNGPQSYVTLTGSVTTSSRLHTSGAQIVDANNKPVRLRSINWFGAESDLYMPHGLWARGYKEIIDQIKAMGFNCIRLPFSGDVCNTTRMPKPNTIQAAGNADIINATAIGVLDAVIGYCAEKQIYIILDHHRRTAGGGADGSPVDATYTLDKWLASWRFMANRYAVNEWVIGADVHNEPHSLDWATWAGYAEQAGNAIHEIQSQWIIFVQGVAQYGSVGGWWGGVLTGVRDRPVRLKQRDHLAYSPHEYGQSVGKQAWLADNTGTYPAGWPLNLYAIWRERWGFIFEEGIAPIWVGEFGGHFGADGNGTVGVVANAEFEAQWLYHLELYLNGDFDGSGRNQLEAGQQGMSFAYWSFNPNSGDTGGLVCDDWKTPQTFKLRLLEPLMAGISLDYLTSLDPIAAGSVGDADLTLINHQGKDFSMRISEVVKFMQNRLYAVDSIHWFRTKVDPNALYPGQKWMRVNLPNRTIRLAATDGSDVMGTGGSDSVTLSAGQMPQHGHSVNINTSSTDLGTKQTDQQGQHTHGGVPNRANPWEIGGNNWTSFNYQQIGQTDAAGLHAHNVYIGPHAHNVSGVTGNSGNGQPIDVTNQYVKLAAWYRAS